MKEYDLMTDFVISFLSIIEVSSIIEKNVDFVKVFWTSDVALLQNNAKIGAQIAVALNRLEREAQHGQDADDDSGPLAYHTQPQASHEKTEKVLRMRGQRERGKPERPASFV